MAFLDRGREVLDKVMKDCEGLGKVEVPPRMEGRYMRMMLSPVPQKKKTAKAPEDSPKEDSPEEKE
jgi:translation initiation factor IF-3